MSYEQDLYLRIPTLALLHTSPVHIATFEALLAEYAPGITARHLVDESLLAEARRAGVTPELAARIAGVLEAAFAAGADALLCTCSTIGGCVEQIGVAAGRAVLRVDRPMAERAVQLGRRVVVVAALASTLAPTTDLLRDAAARAGRQIELSEVLCAGAWQSFEQGDLSGYQENIAAHLRAAAPQADVLVLAQASMSGAAALCADLPLPILSSPRLGLEAAIQLMQRGAPPQGEAPR